jgi:Domain of unknown function DUF29
MNMIEANLKPNQAPRSSSNLYESDFYAWVQQQTMLLQDHQWNEIDIANLIEEISSLGRQQQQELRNRLSVLIGHLLKWQYQPQRRSRSWLATLRVQRREILRLLKDNPSLKPYLDEARQEAHENGCDLAMGETNLPEKTFPLDCPYSLAEILADRFYPGEPSELVDGVE